MTSDPVVVVCPLQGSVVSVEVAVGGVVRAGQPLVIVESMKMEHVVEATAAGKVTSIAATPGQTVQRGDALVTLESVTETTASTSADAAPASDVTDGVEASGVTTSGAAGEPAAERRRADLAEVIERHEVGMDERRPEAVARRHHRGQRTARENITDLVDPGSFVEYGPLAIAAQRRRRDVQELIERTPADGLVGGLATVEGRRVVVASYDYTVLAGTQGYQNHRKKDRLFELAAELRLPVVLFAEGGGGRPGDTDSPGVSGLDTMAFRLFAELSGLVPLVGITSGRCFAGNAALLGCCDVVIATEGSNIGMGGPAMIEGGGLGVFTPEEVGPLEVQAANGVVDIAVADEAAAVDAARRYLSYFRSSPVAGDGSRSESAADPDVLRSAVPENRLRVYDMRALLEALVDCDSLLELRRGFGAGMVTAFARVEGRPIGIIANNPAHLGGAIDAAAADKAARFMQLCDAFDVPLLSVCDTPGFMVGPSAEETALVRHVSRMFVTGANLTIPLMTVITRKAYGLGAQAMAGGSFKSPLFTVAWPTGEVGGMGLEGAVRLGYRRELEAIADEAEREAAFQQMVARSYEHGKALNSASHYEIDDVIDPADTRRWIVAALESAPPPVPRTGKKRPNVDTW